MKALPMTRRIVVAATTTAVLATAVLLAFGLVAPAGAADVRAEPQARPVVAQFSYSPTALPPLPVRHQNHCGFVSGHYVCADHCGVDYQVYYCPASASGCCHVGYGYCDGAGQLRCMAPWYDFSSLLP
jgi:hypothetical protein